MTQTRSLLEIARENARLAQERLAEVEKRAIRRELIVRDYDGGSGMSVPELAKSYEIATETVRTNLKAAGVYKAQPRVAVTPELRERIIAALGDNPNPADQALGFGLSASTIRKIGQEAGLFTKPTARPRRSDEDYRQIKMLDDQLKARWGVGMLSLGTGLRAWEKAQEIPPAGIVLPSDPDSDAEPW